MGFAAAVFDDVCLARYVVSERWRRRRKHEVCVQLGVAKQVDGERDEGWLIGCEFDTVKIRRKAEVHSAGRGSGATRICVG